MQIFKRPPKADDFDTKVKADRKKIADHFKKKKPLAEPEVSTPAADAEGSATKIDFPPRWGEYKLIFAEAQYGKCGYCEMMVIGGQPGDVEHFSPKGEIWLLDDDPVNWGVEKKWASTVEGRKRQVVSDQGYWWLAYEWANYLLSCTVCNQYWKLSYFPVKNQPRAIPPSKKTGETILLLNPFDEGVDPAAHFKFNENGQIEVNGGSDHGFETIRTCGLDRESLRRSRKEKAERAYYLLIELNEAITEDDAQKKVRVLNDFDKLANNEYIHSGMVRIIFEHGSGMKWSDLEGLLNP